MARICPLFSSSKGNSIYVGNSSEGVIVFPALSEGAFTLIIEGSSDNWEEKLNPYTFNIEG